DGRRMPLETLVERENIRPLSQTASLDKLRLAAETGQQFLRMLELQTLSRDYRNAFIKEFQFAPLTPAQRATLAADSISYFDLMAPRVPDGRRLYAAFRPNSSGAIVLPPSLQVAAGDATGVDKAARAWSLWYETLFSEPDSANPSWLSERQEYSFSVGARLSDREYVLTATEYTDGHLDWHAFDS